MVAIIFPLFLITFFAIVFISEIRRRHKFDLMQAVKQGIEYSNNHHVLGVGYYHAAARQWFKHPWNEFREGHGYHWDGSWHPTPDTRIVAKSTPSPEEVFRVNKEWRDADPDRTRQFWETVDREGFGTAIGRREGS